LLGLDDERAILVQAGDDVMAANLFAVLLRLPNADVMRVLAMLAAETLASGSAHVEAAGAHLKVDTAKTWTPDDAFFDLVRDCLDDAKDWPKVRGWLPGWKSFPPRGYTGRGGLRHVDAWPEIAHLFPQV
jgi:ParB family transcriptional regulator, chromosome partitioning protein